MPDFHHTTAINQMNTNKKINDREQKIPTWNTYDKEEEFIYGNQKMPDFQQISDLHQMPNCENIPTKDNKRPTLRTYET